MSRRIGLKLLFFFALGFALLPSTSGQAAQDPKLTDKQLKPSPNMTALYAELFPGAGYFYMGDTQTGLAASSLILPLALPYYITTPTFAAKSAKINSYTLARNVFGYSVYDSYQTALDLNGRPELPVKVPHYAFSELLFAPFSVRSYASWMPWLPIALAGYAGGSRIASKGIHEKAHGRRLAISIPAILVASLFVGMGEEVEFRGTQYPVFSDVTKSKDLGNLMQAVSFGACHTTWGICSTPYFTGQIFRATNTIESDREYRAPSNPYDGTESTNLQYFMSTALFGAFMGVMVQKHEHGLLMSTVAHQLYDFILITSSLLTEGNTGRVYLSINLPI